MFIRMKTDPLEKVDPSTQVRKPTSYMLSSRENQSKHDKLMRILTYSSSKQNDQYIQQQDRGKPIMESSIGVSSEYSDSFLSNISKSSRQMDQLVSPYLYKEQKDISQQKKFRKQSANSTPAKIRQNFRSYINSLNSQQDNNSSIQFEINQIMTDETNMFDDAFNMNPYLDNPVTEKSSTATLKRQPQDFKIRSTSTQAFTKFDFLSSKKELSIQKSHQKSNTQNIKESYGLLPLANVNKQLQNSLKTQKRLFQDKLQNQIKLPDNPKLGLNEVTGEIELSRCSTPWTIDTIQSYHANYFNKQSTSTIDHDRRTQKINFDLSSADPKRYRGYLGSKEKQLEGNTSATNTCLSTQCMLKCAPVFDNIHKWGKFSRSNKKVLTIKNSNYYSQTNQTTIVLQ